MKKVLFALVAFFATTLGANAMSFEQAREQALFLTDKMAYELNLTDDQYEAAYEVNLDYLLGINTESDLYGVYWTNRNLDMSYILAEWQYRAFCDALYFYRPIYWGSGYWHFRIFARYPHRTFFYFGRPAFYHTYHGGHSWRHHGGSYYHGRTYGVAHRSGGNGHGMRDSYRGTNNHGGFNNHGNGGNHGGYNNNNHGNGGNNRGNGNYGNGGRQEHNGNGVRPEGNRNRGGNYGNGGRTDNNGNVRPSTNRGTGSNVDRTVTPSRERTYRNATAGSSTTTPSRSISNSGSMSRNFGNSGISTRSSSSSSSMGSMSRSSSFSGGSHSGGFSGGGSRGGGFSGGGSHGGGFGGGHGGGSHGGRH